MSSYRNAEASSSRLPLPSLPSPSTLSADDESGNCHISSRRSKRGHVSRRSMGHDEQDDRRSQQRLAACPPRPRRSARSLSSHTTPLQACATLLTLATFASSAHAASTPPTMEAAEVKMQPQILTRSANIVDMVICLFSVVGSLIIIIPYAASKHSRKLRHSLILGLATSDLILR